MAVAPGARGRGYGDLLMEAAVAFSRRTGARRMMIVSNTRLGPGHPAVREARVRPGAAGWRISGTRGPDIKLERVLEPLR